jgi:hypothetical protein
VSRSDIRTEDQFILGGFDYESQFIRITTFATSVINMTPNLEPFERPSGLMRATQKRAEDNEI